MHEDTNAREAIWPYKHRVLLESARLRRTVRTFAEGKGTWTSVAKENAPHWLIDLCKLVCRSGSDYCSKDCRDFMHDIGTNGSANTILCINAENVLCLNDIICGENPLRSESEARNFMENFPTLFKTMRFLGESQSVPSEIARVVELLLEKYYETPPWQEQVTELSSNDEENCHFPTMPRCRPAKKYTLDRVGLNCDEKLISK